MPLSHEDNLTNSSHDEDDTNDYDDEIPTPLPIYPLLSIYLIQLAEPITATVIYPFINQFVRETGITGGDEKKTGYYAGIIESAFFFAESLTVVQWGYLSDRYGRRPILLCGPIGLALSMLAFGMSTTFWPLVLSRCLQGIFNGNIGVSKSAIAEASFLTDSSNRGDAYAFIPMVWSFGFTTGPLLGGILSNPAVQWPNSLGRIPYLRTHPYFLPCFLAALFAFATFIFVCFALKETLPSLVAQENALKSRQDISDDMKSTTATVETTLINHGDNHNYGTADVAANYPADLSEASTLIVQDDGNPPERRGLGAVVTRPILMTLMNHVCLAFLDMSNFTLLPLVYSTPIAYGGLGLDPFQIGVILGVFGFVNSIIQAKLLGRFIRKYGARNLYRVSFTSFLVCLTMYPLMHFFAQRVGRVNGFVVACIFTQLSFQTAIYMAYGSLQVILVECVPEGGPMGTVNGVAQMLGSGMRSIAPSFASSLFAVSLQRKLAGGNMVYYILIAMTLCGIGCSTLLPQPKTVKAKRRSLDSRSPSQSPSRTSG